MDNNTRFNQYHQALQQYIQREGNALVPATHTEKLDGQQITLGAWVGYMRQRNKNGKLPQNRQQTLNNTQGWTWGPLKPGPTTKTLRNTDIHTLRQTGQSLSQIADQYNLSRQRIHQIIKRTTTTPK
jgi:Mor family transcriptional regulator